MFSATPAVPNGAGDHGADCVVASRCCEYRDDVCSTVCSHLSADRAESEAELRNRCVSADCAVEHGSTPGVRRQSDGRWGVTLAVCVVVGSASGATRVYCGTWCDQGRPRRVAPGGRGASTSSRGTRHPPAHATRATRPAIRSFVFVMVFVYRELSRLVL